MESNLESLMISILIIVLYFLDQLKKTFKNILINNKQFVIIKNKE